MQRTAELPPAGPHDFETRLDLKLRHRVREKRRKQDPFIHLSRHRRASTQLHLHQKMESLAIA